MTVSTENQRGALAVGFGSSGGGGTPEDRVYAEIHSAIAELRLPPGTKLVEESLAEIFGVSRARLRKVLLVLAQEKIVNLEPNRGAFVAQPTVDEARQVFAARRLIEDAIVRDVAGRITSAGIERLRQVVALEQEARRRHDRGAVIKLSGEFHTVLAEFGGNRILAEFLDELVARCYLIVAVYEAPGDPGCSRDDHGKLIDDLAAGEAGRAADEMRRHFDNIESRLDLAPARATEVDFRSIFAAAADRRGAPGEKRHEKSRRAV